ncbi:MAG: hypothetical protein KF850_23570 [Labilithrix sp.]|nr:hypothetical protein [Labilithrix sp.]
MPVRPHLVAALFASLALIFWSRAARAERELIVPFHEGGHIVFDQLSGLRLDATSGVAYAGPAGVAFRSTKSDALVPGGPSSETSTTSVWFAPSADVFVTDHLSVGGRVEIAHTWGAIEGGGRRLELPGTTSMTFLPRVGFFVPFGDRFGIWPRAGVGWCSVESVSFASTGSAPTRDTFRAMLLDVDLSLVYRFGETFFMRAGPEVGVTLGGRQTSETGGTSAGAGASVLQISGTIGFGMNLEL